MHEPLTSALSLPLRALAIFSLVLRSELESTTSISPLERHKYSLGFNISCKPGYRKSCWCRCLICRPAYDLLNLVLAGIWYRAGSRHL
ncbi:hypothetical protein CS542_09515 [Pedobacter sp. IW39]|nr:hypothetical protein CS542_09515 [Pedobacter sp. IW39]